MAVVADRAVTDRSGLDSLHAQQRGVVCGVAIRSSYAAVCGTDGRSLGCEEKVSFGVV